MINIIGKRYWFSYLGKRHFPGIISLIAIRTQTGYRFSERYYHDLNFSPAVQENAVASECIIRRRVSKRNYSKIFYRRIYH